MRFLAADYPRSIDKIILRRGLQDLSYPLDDDQLDAYLAYLSERKYITIEKRDRFDIVLITITATGLNVIDGFIDDPGVGVKI